MRLHNAAFILLIMCAPGIFATLSKSSRKKTAKVDSSEVDAKSESARLKKEILDSHAQLDTGERSFSAGPIFGYVTPWNNHGYDVAKWAANKFTHIVPVWFQINALTSTGKKTCQIGGTHDMDQGWIAEVRANNSEVKILPRLLLENWSPENLEEFLVDESWQIRCGKDLVNFLLRNQFDGAVLEVWIQIMAMTRGQGAQMVTELIEDWTETFHKKKLLVVIPIPPPLRDSHEDVGLFAPAYLEKLVRKVDYVNVMTYDFPSAQPTGVAPYYWVQANLDWIINAGVQPERILMGLNFYGYDRTDGRMDAITFPKYLEVLGRADSRIEWDDAVMEHRVRWGSKGVLYYPTQRSLQMRIDLAKQMRIGVAIWDLGQGLDHFMELL
uniref:Chitinase domain-containing protein 1 n=2 Tax=Steinernema glaseri TaxID=37863 RepID=A0A1I7Y764_9BILA